MNIIFKKHLLREWIQQAGKGAKTQLAYKADISPSYIDKLLRDDGPMPRVDVAKKICATTGILFDELFTEDIAA